MASNIRSQGCTEIPEEQGSSPTEAVNMDDTDQSTDSSVSDSPQSCAQTHGRSVNTSSRDFEPSGTIMPSSGCGCQGTVRQKVYAIGELDIDLVSPARRDSIQANAPRLPPMFGFDASIENRFTFLRYLLGIDFKPEAGIGDEMRAAIDEARRGALVNGNFYDAASVIWVLKQGECPMYAIKPQGAFAEAAYRQLVIFLIEQTFRNYQEFTQQGVSEHCLDEFYNCFGGTQQPFRDSLSRPETVSLTEGAQNEGGGSPPQTRRRRGKDEAEQDGEAGRSPAAGGTRTADVINRAFDLFNEPHASATHVAIAGEITGKCQLFTGEQVEVIAPVMRGMQNWNTRRLIEALLRSLDVEGVEEQATLFGLKVISRLYDLVRNPGKDPCDRAKNYLATKELFNLALTLSNPAFLSMLGAYGPPANAGDRRNMEINLREFLNIMVDNLECKPARCIRYGTEPYEVELSFYNFANQFMGSAVVSQTIDVSDVVPVALDRPRVFPRRS